MNSKLEDLRFCSCEQSHIIKLLLTLRVFAIRSYYFGFNFFHIWKSYSPNGLWWQTINIRKIWFFESILNGSKELIEIKPLKSSPHLECLIFFAWLFFLSFKKTISSCIRKYYIIAYVIQQPRKNGTTSLWCLYSSPWDMKGSFNTGHEFVWRNVLS